MGGRSSEEWPWARAESAGCGGARGLACAVLAIALDLASVPGVGADTGDLEADQVLGQSGFEQADSPALGAGTFALPNGVAIDRSVTPNRLYVMDLRHARVLGWSDVDALVDGAPADLVIGQLDFVSYGCNHRTNSPGIPAGSLRLCALPPELGPALPPINLSTLCDPAGLAVDSNGNLYVADRGARRVVGYLDPFGTDSVGDVVLGRPDPNASLCLATFEAVVKLAVDGFDNLYVVDEGSSASHRCRVARFDQPLATDDVADAFFEGCDLSFPPPFTGTVTWSVAVAPSGGLFAGSGQGIFQFDDPLASGVVDRVLTGASCTDLAFGTPTPETFGGCPEALAVAPDGRLYMADAQRSRVLSFPSPTTSSLQDLVFGSASADGSGHCNASGLNASSLCLFEFSTGLTHLAAALDVDASGRLYVADHGNHRVLRYDTPTTSQAADLVLGQATMDTALRPVVEIGLPRGLVTPFDLVVDQQESRLLLYTAAPSLPSAGLPSHVGGQPNISSTGCNTGGVSEASLCRPSAGVATIGTSRFMLVADTGNNRVLRYDGRPVETDPATGVPRIRSADAVYGQPDFGSNACGTGPGGLCAPEGVAFAVSDGAFDLYVADTGNNRVLYYKDFLNDSIADRVFGQPDFSGTACNAGGVSASSLCRPRGLAVAGTADVLVVADSGNHRVLIYRDASTSTGAADVVLGQQGSFGSQSCGVGANSLCEPTGVAIDLDAQILVVADSLNNRVLQFDEPLLDTSADRVFGQSGMLANACNAGGISARSLCAPLGVSLWDRDGITIWIADSGNRRVLRFDDPVAGRQPADESTQKCILDLNKSLAKVSRTREKLLARCVKRHARGEVVGPAALEDCLLSDPGGELAKATARTFSRAAKRCLAPPPFGPESPDDVNLAGSQGAIELLEAVYGPAPGDVIVTEAADKVHSRCQTAVLKAIQKCHQTSLKEFNRCKKDGLAAGTLTNFLELQACLEADPKGKVAKACDSGDGKIRRQIDRRCVGQDLDSSFPGCAGAPGGLFDCLESWVRCHLCVELDTADRLRRDCDVFDDGTVNGSCFEGFVAP